MTTNYKSEEKFFNSTISKYVQPTEEGNSINLHIYYKNKKLKNLFVRNSSINSDVYSVVYKYTCQLEPCNGSHTYIGYTTTLLKQRLTSHTQQGSIQKHNSKVHNKKAKLRELLENTQVLTKFSNKTDLHIAEALLIKSMTPSLNEQNEFSDRTLKIF